MKILLSGDIHSAVWGLDRVMHRAEVEKVEAVFFLGDFGWDFSPRFINTASLWYENTGIPIYFIDGNHEDFDILYEYEVGEDGLRTLAEGLKHVPRGTVMNLDGHNVLLIGGASSIDKMWRTEGTSWWPQELITEDDVDMALANCADLEITAVFSHEGPMLPANSNKTDEDLIAYSPALEADVRISQDQRAKLMRIGSKVKPKFWYHGHHHTFAQSVMYHDDGECLVQCLAHETSKLYEQTVIIHTEDWYVR